MVAHDAAIAVYIVTNKPYGTLYIGVTSHLLIRIGQHRDGVYPGFTRQHGSNRLVWFERFDLMTNAIRREKQMKEWRRDWKINLIEQENPRWDDLFLQMTVAPPGPLNPLTARDYAQS